MIQRCAVSTIFSRETVPLTSRFQIPETAYRFIDSLGELWGTGPMSSRLTLKISARMIRSLGNCRPETGMIRLNRILFNQRNSEILREVLCHEAAHAAVFLLHGRNCRPHGPEWKALMKAAQYAPRRRIPEVRIHGRLLSGKRRHYRYAHRCLDCGRIFLSGRTDYRWRCKRCLNLGLDGYLELVKRQMV